MNPKTLAVIVAAGLATIPLAGCATLGGTPAKATASTQCTTTASQNPTTPIVAVLGATGSTDTETAQADQQALQKVISGSERLKANLLLIGVNGSTEPPNLLMDTQMTANGINTLFAQSNLKCKEAAVHEHFAVLAKLPAGHHLDLLSALRVLRRDLDGVKPSVVHVVVLSPALQTETVDLANGQTLDNPASSINLLSNQQLNFTCAGWRIYMVSENLKNGRPIDPTTDVRLQAWWAAYFARCGGSLVTYNNELGTFPLGPQAVAGADFSHVGFSVTQTPTKIIATISGDTLFNTGSAQLRPGAARGLNLVLPLLGKAVSPSDVIGYTDNTGTDQFNLPLSLHRAQAVTAWLIAHSGFPAAQFRVIGRGSNDPAASNDTAADRKLNRRVVVAIHRTTKK